MSNVCYLAVILIFLVVTWWLLLVIYWLLLVSARYWWLLLVNARYCSFSFLVWTWKHQEYVFWITPANDCFCCFQTVHHLETLLIQWCCKVLWNPMVFVNFTSVACQSCYTAETKSAKGRQRFNYFWILWRKLKLPNFRFKNCFQIIIMFDLVCLEQESHNKILRSIYHGECVRQLNVRLVNILVYHHLPKNKLSLRTAS